MPVRNMKRRQYEEQYAASRTPLLILAAIACFGAAVLLFYIAVAAPQQGTAMGAIRDVMRGLGGSLSVALPLVFAWAGVLCILAVRGKNPPVWKMILDLAMVLALFAAVHGYASLLANNAMRYDPEAAAAMLTGLFDALIQKER